MSPLICAEVIDAVAAVNRIASRIVDAIRLMVVPPFDSTNGALHRMVRAPGLFSLTAFRPERNTVPGKGSVSAAWSGSRLERVDRGLNVVEQAGIGTQLNRRLLRLLR